MPSSVYPYSYFSLSDLTVQEGQEAQVTVSRVGDSSTDVLINLSITSGTAKSGSDYTDFTGNKLTTKNAILETSGYSKSNIIVNNILTIDASGNSEIELYGAPTKIEMKRFIDSAALTKKQMK